MENFFLNAKVLPRAQDPDALILHPHAQRTGGNTMRRLVFAAVYGAEHVHSRVYLKKKPVWKKMSDADFEGMRVFCDHFDFRSNPRVTRPLLPVAVLRHPLYRTVSVYYFVRRKKTHREYALANELKLEEFYERASAINPRYYKNLQCRRICGIDDASMALERIDQKFLGVGFTEHLDEFVAALGKALGWPALDIEGAEPDAERYDGLISPSFRERVLADNAEDMFLYETMRNGSPQARPERPMTREARTVLNRAILWARGVTGI